MTRTTVSNKIRECEGRAQTLGVTASVGYCAGRWLRSHASALPKGSRCAGDAARISGSSAATVPVWSDAAASGSSHLEATQGFEMGESTLDIELEASSTWRPLSHHTLVNSMRARLARSVVRVGEVGDRDAVARRRICNRAEPSHASVHTPLFTRLCSHASIHTSTPTPLRACSRGRLLLGALTCRTRGAAR